jgi:hypothetical protein
MDCSGALGVLKNHVMFVTNLHFEAKNDHV